MNNYVKTKSYETFTIKVIDIIEHYYFFLQESFKLEDKINNNIQNDYGKDYIDEIISYVSMIDVLVKGEQ